MVPSGKRSALAPSCAANRELAKLYRWLLDKSSLEIVSAQFVAFTMASDSFEIRVVETFEEFREVVDGIVSCTASTIIYTTDQSIFQWYGRAY